MALRTAAELGAIARAARRAAGWTQEQAAREAGVSRQFVISLESGQHPNAELWRVLAVLSAVGVTLSASFNEGPPEQASSRPAVGPPARSPRPPVMPSPAPAVIRPATSADGGEAEFDLDQHLATFAASPLEPDPARREPAGDTTP